MNFFLSMLRGSSDNKDARPARRTRTDRQAEKRVRAIIDAAGRSEDRA